MFIKSVRCCSFFDAHCIFNRKNGKVRNYKKSLELCKNHKKQYKTIVKYNQNKTKQDKTIDKKDMYCYYLFNKTRYF